MEVKAQARYIRMSPRKIRLVVDAVRGMDVSRAQTQLRFMKKAAALPVLKLLNSAVANAQHNFKLASDDLFIKTIVADGGPVLHRWRARAMGRAAPIKKRTTHISITLASRTGKKVEEPKPAAKKEAKKAEKKPAAKKPAAKKTSNAKKS